MNGKCWQPSLPGLSRPRSPEFIKGTGFSIWKGMTGRKKAETTPMRRVKITLDAKALIIVVDRTLCVEKKLLKRRECRRNQGRRVTQAEGKATMQKSRNRSMMGLLLSNYKYL
jgi:hypothetical protein